MSKLRFCLDKESEKYILLFFSNPNNQFIAGANIFKLYIKGYPQLEILPSLSMRKRKIMIGQFIDNEHVKRRKRLKQDMITLRKKWNKKEKLFLKISSQLFDNHPWSKGHYTAVISILNSFPRFIKEKKFHTPPKKVKGGFDPCYVIAHECLHFMFFDYFDKNFKGQLPKMLEWELSEIINQIIQKREPLNKLYIHNSWGIFPKLQKKLAFLDDLYTKCATMHEFMEGAILFLKKETSR